MNIQTRLALAVFLAISCAASRAGSLPDLIAKVKPSVVLVGSYGLMDSPRFGFRGTGFVVGDGRHVLTNVHVLPPDLAGRVDRSVAIQYWTEAAGWTLVGASLERTDTLRDLALLKLEGLVLPALTLATPEVREGAEVLLVGFPLGGALGYSHVSHRGIVSARTAIAPQAVNANSLQPRALMQLRQGSFDVLQLDATAYPGNSGGPVIAADSGEVVGIVNMVFLKGTKESALSTPSGITYAIRAQDAAKLLAE